MEAKVLSNAHATLRWIGGLHLKTAFLVSIKNCVSLSMLSTVSMTTSSRLRKLYCTSRNCRTILHKMTSKDTYLLADASCAEGVQKEISQ